MQELPIEKLNLKNTEIHYYIIENFSLKISHKIIDSKLIKVNCDRIFIDKIPTYLESNLLKIMRDIKILDDKILVDFNNDSIKICGRKFKIIWIDNSNNRKKCELFNGSKNIYIFHGGAINNKFKKEKIITALFSLGSESLIKTCKKIAAKHYIQNYKLLIGKNSDSWVDVNKVERIIKINAIAYCLPKTTLNYLLTCNLIYLNSNSNFGDAIKVTDSHFKHAEIHKSKLKY